MLIAKYGDEKIKWRCSWRIYLKREISQNMQIVLLRDVLGRSYPDPLFVRNGQMTARHELSYIE
jgi:hypothetical protein